MTIVHRSEVREGSDGTALLVSNGSWRDPKTGVSRTTRSVLSGYLMRPR